MKNNNIKTNNNKEEKNNDYNILFDEIKEYNSFISNKLINLENKFKKDLNLNDEKINALSKNIEYYKIKVSDLKNVIFNKNKKLKDIEKENKQK